MKKKRKKKKNRPAWPGLLPLGRAVLGYFPGGLCRPGPLVGRAEAGAGRASLARLLWHLYMLLWWPNPRIDPRAAVQVRHPYHLGPISPKRRDNFRVPRLVVWGSTWLCTIINITLINDLFNLGARPLFDKCIIWPWPNLFSLGVIFTILKILFILGPFLLRSASLIIIMHKNSWSNKLD